MDRKVYAYGRVSTREQNLDRQMFAFREYGVPSENIFIDKQSGKDFNRPAYKDMLKTLTVGDTLVIKSLSRFSRNTVDSLTTIRKLKENGVEVWFEKENIWTFQARGEIILTILSSLSQEEVRSISENVTWGLRKKFQDGKFSVGYSRFLGYDKGEDGNLAINEEQAKTVRLIFGLFIEGLTPCAIAKELTRRGILTVTGKSKWNAATINGVLANEKYTACARIQKTFTPDFLTKKTVKNTGQVSSYFVEQSHPAIIAPETFEMVQAEVARRKREGGRYSGVSIFSGKIKCADCGSWFGSKVWHSTDRYRRVIYRCNRKYNGEKCQTPHVTEEEIKVAFISAYNKLVTEKKEIIANAELIRRTLCNTDALQEEKQQLESEMAVLVDMTQNIIAENARIAQDQEEYQKRYDGMVAKYDAAKEKYDETIAAISAKDAQNARLTAFVKALRERDGIIEDFDESLWGCMVEYVTVGRKKEMTVTFRDGTEIQA